jgi:ketosteroid isomerase-like protein
VSTDHAEKVVRDVLSILDDGLASLAARYDEFFGEDFEMHSALAGAIEGGGSYVGREGFMRFTSDFSSVFGDLKIASSTVESVGTGRVLVTAKLDVVASQSGIPVANEVAYVIDVDEGRIMHMRTFLSPRDAREFLELAA